MQSVSQGPGFVHLHVHSSFSLREGALTIAKLGKLAVADRMPALAITDTNNLFGALEFSEKMAKEGVQPIIGLHLAVDFGDGAALGRDMGRGSPRLDRAAGRHGGGLHQPDAAGLRRPISIPTPGDTPHIALDRLAAGTRRADRADRRPVGRHRPRPGSRSRRSRRAPA